MRVVICEELLTQMLTQGYNVQNVECTHGLPQDAVFIASTFDDEKMLCSLIYYHPDFSKVPGGGSIPVVDIEFAKRYA